MAKEAERREAGLAAFAARAAQARAIEAHATDEVRIAEQLRDALMRSTSLRSNGVDGELESKSSTTTARTVLTAASSSYNGVVGNSLDYKDKKTTVAISEQNNAVTNHHQRQIDEVENQRKIQLEHERVMALTELTKTQQRELEKQRLLVCDPSSMLQFFCSILSSMCQAAF